MSCQHLLFYSLWHSLCLGKMHFVKRSAAIRQDASMARQSVVGMESVNLKIDAVVTESVVANQLKSVSNVVALRSKH